MWSWSLRLPPTIMNKKAEYCNKYQNKNTDKISQKDKERKKFETEYVKYCDEKKYKEKKRKDSDRRRLAKKIKLER